MSVVTPKDSTAPEIPDGLYLATVKKVEDIKLDQPDNFGKTEKVVITVAFTDADGESWTLDPRVNRAWSDKANLFKIALACGLDVDPDDAFDTDDLVGCKVNVLVETEEEGHWPRIKSWGRVKQKASAPAEKATAPSSKPVSVIDTDGEPDFDVFWRQMNKAGIDRKTVVDHVGGDIEDLMNMDGPDLQETMNELLEKANG